MQMLEKLDWNCVTSSVPSICSFININSPHQEVSVSPSGGGLHFPLNVYFLSYLERCCSLKIGENQSRKSFVMALSWQKGSPSNMLSWVSCKLQNGVKCGRAEKWAWSLHHLCPILVSWSLWERSVKTVHPQGALPASLLLDPRKGCEGLLAWP